MLDHYLFLTIGAILVNNFVLSQFLGICPFLGVSKKLDTALGMSGAVIFVMTLATLVTSTIYNLVLSHQIPFMGTTVDLKFLKILIFIVVIASLVQLVEIVLQKLSPPLYESLGIFLPLITTNCAVLGAAELNAKEGRSILDSTIFGFCSALGFALALILFASLRERLDLAKVPRPFEGTAIALITAGILAMAFLGFSGLV
jgi:Na+-translocating ferredoxin:NAD+ oxidoreductase subunit A